MPLASVDEIFLQAAVRYEDPESIAVYSAIVYLEGLLVDSAKMASYQKNHTRENVSDIFQHVKDLIAYYNSDLLITEGIAAGADGAVRSGRTTRRVPTRYIDWTGYEV
jgi:hypothetical protein